MDVAVEVDHGHTFEEGVDAKTDKESCDGVDGSIVAVAVMLMMLMVVFFGLFLLLAAGAVVVSVFGTFGELFQQ